MAQLVAEVLAGEPACAAAVRHDVGDWLAVHGQRDPFSSLDGGDHVAGSVTQVPNSNLHVRQCSTGSFRQAHEAGVSKGALYHYFPSKEQLFLALLEERLGAGLSATANTAATSEQTTNPI